MILQRTRASPLWAAQGLRRLTLPAQPPQHWVSIHGCIGQFKSLPRGMLWTPPCTAGCHASFTPTNTLGQASGLDDLSGLTGVRKLRGVIMAVQARRHRIRRPF